MYLRWKGYRMQASKTATEGSNAIVLPEVLGVLGQRLHRRPLGVDPRLQREHVLQLRAAMLADISERQFADVHAMNNKRAGDAQDIRCIVRTEFLLLGDDSNPLALEEMAEDGLEQGCNRRRQPQDLILA